METDPKPKCNRCSCQPSVYVITSFGQEHVCKLCALSLITDGQAQKVAKFVGVNWTIEAEWKPTGIVAGYITDQSAFTEAFDDPTYRNPWGSINAPSGVLRKLDELRELMRANPPAKGIGHRFV